MPKKTIKITLNTDKNGKYTDGTLNYSPGLSRIEALKACIDATSHIAYSLSDPPQPKPVVPAEGQSKLFVEQ